MDYTCKNCKYRNTWDCEDCWSRASDCEDFILDENTLSKQEQTMLRVMRQIARENGK